MKLRMHENSVRLRLRKSEVARFAEEGRLAEAISIGSGALRYELLVADVQETTVDFAGGTLTIAVPRSEAKRWCETDEVGIYVQTPTVEVILEKEFRRTSMRGKYDEDLYPNPRAGMHFQQIDGPE
jgi:hypothetical protein